jgi:hypothetical protein
MTEEELRGTTAFQQLPIPEKQRLLRGVRDGTYDLAAAPSPSPEEYYPDTRGLAGGQRYGPPARTGSVGQELLAPWTAAREAPTLAEQYLPPSIGTTALSGIERGLRLATAPVTAAGNLLQQGLEQTPRLFGLRPTSTPVSRAAAEAPGIAAQVFMPESVGLPRATGTLSARGAQGEQMLADAARVGVPLTRAESVPSGTIGNLYRRTMGWMEGTPLGGGPIDRAREAARTATEDAAQRVGGFLHDQPVSAQAGGEPAQAVSQAAVKAAAEANAARVAAKAQQAGETAQAPTRAYVESLGPPQESPQYLSHVQTHLQTAEDAARAQASTLYGEAERLAGDAPAITLRQTASTATDILAQEAKLGRLAQQPTTGVAGSLRNLAQDVVDQFGLAHEQPVDYGTARALDSRIGGLIRDATDDNVRRQLRTLQKAVRADIDTFAASAPGDLGQKIRAANEFYRTRVAEPFGEASTIRALKQQTGARDLDRVLFDPNAAERTAAIRAEMVRGNPTAWQPVERRFGERLLRDAVDPATGQFSPTRFTAALTKYTPESLAAILGDKAEGVNRLRARFQAAAGGPKALDTPIQAAAVFREFATANPEMIVANLVKRPISEVADLKAALRPEDWAKMARAWWENELLPASYSTDTHVFSRKRFLTQLGKTEPETLQMVLGPEVGDHVDALRRLMQQQEKLHTLGDNPSGTANRLIGYAGLVQASALAGALFSGNVTGITTTGAVVLAPAVLSRMLVTPKGSRLLLGAAQAIPGTRAAQTAAQRIALFLARPTEGDTTP